MKDINSYKAVVLICCIALQLTGCYTPQLATKEELLLAENYSGLHITTRDQKNYAFEPESYLLSNDSVIGKSSLILENGAIVERNVERKISLNEVENIRIDQLDAVKTTFFIAGSVGLGILLGLAVKSIMQGVASDVASGVREGLEGIY